MDEIATDREPGSNGSVTGYEFLSGSLRALSRKSMEVADIFRVHGAAWCAANKGHVSLGQLRAISAIKACRTAALGGHVARCEGCSHTVIGYNSCLMGRSSNGELAGRCWQFPVNCGFSLSP
jgi:hypothetical protein